MAFSLCLPFQTDHGPRARIAGWLARYYQAICPEASVVIGGAGDDEAINRSRLRNRIVAETTSEVVLLVDADCFVSRATILLAVAQLSPVLACVQCERAAYLSHDGTQALLARAPSAETTMAASYIESKLAVCHGLFFAVRRESFDRVGGFDERFIGWGEEDDAFVIAMRMLSGHVARIPATAYHLSHPRPPMAEIVASANFQQNMALGQRYRQALRTQNAAAIRALVGER